MSRKICPIMSYRCCDEDGQPCEVECIQGRCQFWADVVYNAEHRRDNPNCALVLGGITNSAGEVVV
jgi:hypothetical protein